MNFFRYQDLARRQSRRLVVLFIAAVAAVIAAVDAVVLLAIGASRSGPQAFHPFARATLVANADLLTVGALATAAVILLASLYRTARLRHGGGQVARELGGVPVDAGLDDPLHRRLRNVVEEIAIAAGVPVPEIYVLEQEHAINAFAAGYSPSDAAVAVTRGTLEQLDRDELQGVIAHEFSHILNGDMRLNIRLMGALFGLLVLTLIGRRILENTRHFGRARNRGAGAVLAIAFGVMIVGAVGQFFGRWIKAAVSRQREYLADASAVQFTRDTEGIGGALKKIAAYRGGSALTADTEEIGHMLFGAGRRMLLFATHPPIEQRIRRIDPAFDPDELERLAARMVHDEAERVRRAREQEEARAVRAASASGQTPPGGFDAGAVVGAIGQPGWQRLLAAATLTAAIPLDLRRAAQQPQWAPQVLLYTLLGSDRELRERQLLAIAQRMGADTESGVRALLEAAGVPAETQRLPLLELAFPAFKRRPPEYAQRLLATVKELVVMDGRTEVFEWVLARVLGQHLWESQNPHAYRVSGRRPLTALRQEASRVLAVLADHGHADRGEVEQAIRAGLAELDFDPESIPRVDDWMAALDADLPRLDRLSGEGKERLVRALVRTVAHDRRVAPAELELLRAVCDLIHVPMPLLAGNFARGAG